MTLPEFSQIFAVLAVQLRQTDADEATIRGYYKPLANLDVEFVAMAAERLAATAEWFPKTSEWRAMAMLIERERIAEQRAVMAKLPYRLCVACDDTGWELGPDGVRRCACVATRRLEVLGRRPLPALPPASDERLVPVDVEHIAKTMATTKGMR